MNYNTYIIIIISYSTSKHRLFFLLFFAAAPKNIIYLGSAKTNQVVPRFHLSHAFVDLFFFLRARPRWKHCSTLALNVIALFFQTRDALASTFHV